MKAIILVLVVCLMTVHTVNGVYKGCCGDEGVPSEAKVRKDPVFLKLKREAMIRAQIKRVKDSVNELADAMGGCLWKWTGKKYTCIMDVGRKDSVNELAEEMDACHWPPCVPTGRR